jgi:flagellar protein FlaJ
MAVKRLKARLHTGVSTELAWQKFVGETGSEHVHRSVTILRDAVDLGADPGKAGDQSSFYAMKIALLRARRKLVSVGFSWLVVVMHAAITGLMLFLCGVLMVFAGAIKGMGSMEAGGYGGVLPTFGFFGDASQLELFRTVVIIVIAVFTVANAFVIRAAEGGHHYKFLFYFGILAAVSGLAILVTPNLVSMALGSIVPIM